MVIDRDKRILNLERHLRWALMKVDLDINRRLTRDGMNDWIKGDMGKAAKARLILERRIDDE